MSVRNTLNVGFHGIGEPARTLEKGEPRYWVSEFQFHGLLDTFVGKTNLHISFDDGNVSDYLIGFPALRERGLKATFFMVAARLNRSGSLTREHLAEMHAAGMAVGTHGMDHRPWVGLSQVDRKRELIDARRRLEDELEIEIDQAALPLGRYNRGLLGELRSLGYATVYTSDWRWAEADGWLQPRFTANTTHTPDSFWADAMHARSGLRRARQAAVGTVKRLR